MDYSIAEICRELDGAKTASDLARVVDLLPGIGSDCVDLDDVIDILGNTMVDIECVHASTERALRTVAERLQLAISRVYGDR